MQWHLHSTLEIKFLLIVFLGQRLYTLLLLILKHLVYQIFSIFGLLYKFHLDLFLDGLWHLIEELSAIDHKNLSKLRFHYGCVFIFLRLLIFIKQFFTDNWEFTNFTTNQQPIFPADKFRLLVWWFLYSPINRYISFVENIKMKSILPFFRDLVIFVHQYFLWKMWSKNNWAVHSI